jgi:hypothetical protein
MPKNLRQRHLLFYGAFLLICSILILGWMISSPSEPGNAVLLGFSSARLFLALGLFIALIFFLWLTIKSAKDPAWAKRTLEEWFGNGRFQKVTGWLGGISFWLGWIGFFVPPYFGGKFENYWIQLQPLILFILLVGVATLTVFYITQRKSSFRDSIYFPILRGGMILLLICMPVLAFMLFSKFGMYSTEDFWYGAGVPILAAQLIAAITGGVFFLRIEKKWKLKRFDLFVSVLLIAVTAFLWMREPLQKSFLLIGPFSPNQALYPFADATLFDIGSQFALIGQRILVKNSFFFERPLYLSFLVYLHTLFGQDYGTLMAVQAGIFAIFPALIYLIGRSLNLRSVGFAAALIVMLRGINSIAASNLIDMANPKMMLTDFPAAIGVAFVVLATCEWLKAPNRNLHFALWLGGVLGFTLMLRTNALILLALIPLYAFFQFAPHWKKWLFNSSLILLAIIAITLPWELRNRSLGGQMYSPIISKFQNVINQRYLPASQSTNPASQLFMLQNTHLFSALYQGNDPIAPDCQSIACFVPNHFLHNIITSILILPTSPVMDNLRRTVGANSYWSPIWNGVFTLPALFFFVLNLFIIVLGISLAWNRQRFPGIAPFAIFLFYDLSNGFARTSGGRYIVPMDWIITIYFLLGVFQAIFWFANTLGMDWKFESGNDVQDTDSKFTPTELSKIIIVIIVLLGFGTLIPLSEKLHLERYQNFEAEPTLIKNEQVLNASGLNITSIKTFLQSKDAEMLVGRALYPRFYKKDQGEPIFYPTLKMPFPRTTFTLIGPKGEYGVILPGGVPEYFPHASDVLVIGCKGENYFDALAVIVLDENISVYPRNPQSGLQCPLAQP